MLFTPFITMSNSAGDAELGSQLSRLKRCREAARAIVEVTEGDPCIAQAALSMAWSRLLMDLMTGCEDFGETIAHIQKLTSSASKGRQKSDPRQTTLNLSPDKLQQIEDALKML